MVIVFNIVNKVYFWLEFFVFMLLFGNKDIWVCEFVCNENGLEVFMDYNVYYFGIL